MERNSSVGATERQANPVMVAVAVATGSDQAWPALPGKAAAEVAVWGQRMRRKRRRTRCPR